MVSMLQLLLIEVESRREFLKLVVLNYFKMPWFTVLFFLHLNILGYGFRARVVGGVCTLEL